MNKKKKNILTVVGIVLGIVLLAFLANNFFSIIGRPATYYSTVNYSPDGLTMTYSGVESPDGNVFTDYHAFRQWAGGNIGGNFDTLYKNPSLINFYLKNGLNVNPSDFKNINDGGDCFSYNTFLTPTYCKVPSASIINFLNVDSDGCPHYTLYSAHCYNACPGATTSCNTCDNQILTDANFGGVADGVSRNYKSLLESNGFSYSWLTQNPVNRCPSNVFEINSGGIPSSSLNNLTNSLSCTVSGNYRNCDNNGNNCDSPIPFTEVGKVNWEGANGFACELASLPNPTKTDMRFDGTVEFKKAENISVFNLVNNQCVTNTKPSNQLTADDYLVITDCQSHIVIAPTCSDGIQNGNETGTDCGGSCSACALPLCKDSDWTFTLSPEICTSSSTQTRTWTLIGNCAFGVQHPATDSISCDSNTCMSFEYSEFGVCGASGTQSRSIISSSPVNCNGGSPILSQTCSSTGSYSIFWIILVSVIIVIALIILLVWLFRR